MARIGVYLCECGPNIRGALDLDALAKAVIGLAGVVRVEQVPLMCAQEGQDLLKQEIAAHELDRVVIAGCSPREHESTFRGALEAAGKNPYFLQVANIREQCAWVVQDRDRATALAARLVEAAVARVVRHEPLKAMEVPCETDVVVIGAGTAGIQAALALARPDRTVHLVERLPVVGGRVPLYEDLFPGTACASCIVDPILDEVLHHKRIRVHLLSRVESVRGFKGSFTVRIRLKARYVDPNACIGCGACVETCPVSVPDAFNAGRTDRRAVYLPYPGALPYVAVIDFRTCLRWQGGECGLCEETCPFQAVRFDECDRVEEIRAGALVLATGFDLYDPATTPQYGYGRVPDVITSYELERRMNTAGPSGGEVVCEDGRTPEHIGFVLCVGSRDSGAHPHCSEVCCRYTLKAVRTLLSRGLEVRMTVFHSDLCLPGRESQDLYRELLGEPSVSFVRMERPNAVRIEENEGRPVVRVRTEAGEDCAFGVDMVVLAPAMVGTRHQRDLARILHLRTEDAGFLERDRSVLNPVGTARDGIFVAGCAGGPCDVPGATAQAQAAAGRILSELIPGEPLHLDPAVARVDDVRCSGCGVCEGLCVYGALAWREEERRAEVNPVLCRGCGVCAAGCPSGAIQCLHVSDDQVCAELDGLLGRLTEQQTGG